MYTNLMKKNFSLFSETENGFFLSFKESQYSLRRERIEEYCSKKDQKFGRKIVKSSLIYDDVDGVSYCQIAKVASSSWCNHFIKLGKLDLFWSMLGCLTIKYWTNLLHSLVSRQSNTFWVPTGAQEVTLQYISILHSIIE